MKEWQRPADMRALQTVDNQHWQSAVDCGFNWPGQRSDSFKFFPPGRSTGHAVTGTDGWSTGLRGYRRVLTQGGVLNACFSSVLPGS